MTAPAEPTLAPALRPAAGALRVALVLGAVYLFWGSTSPAMKVAIETLPPFAMVTVRFFCGGLLLWAVARARRVPLPQPREWRSALLSGAVLLVASNALYCWSLLAMPSGLGSLFFALSPLWMVLFAARYDGERLAPIGVAGLGLGLGGMILIFAPAARHGLPLWGIAVDTFCSIAWALGSVVQKRFASTDLVQTSAMQMLLAAPMTLAISLLTHEHSSLERTSAPSLAALAFLIVGGSVVGFSAFLWLMRNVPTALASTYAYANPVVSIAIGTLFLHEPLRPSAAAGAAVVIAGVALMMLAPGAKTARAGAVAKA